MTNMDNCHADATCTDTPGAFTCMCNMGYNGDGVTCTNSESMFSLSIIRSLAKHEDRERQKFFVFLFVVLLEIPQQVLRLTYRVPKILNQ